MVLKMTLYVISNIVHISYFYRCQIKITAMTILVQMYNIRISTSSRSYMRTSLSAPLLTNKLRNGEHLMHVILPPCLSYSSITGSISVASPEIDNHLEITQETSNSMKDSTI